MDGRRRKKLELQDTIIEDSIAEKVAKEDYIYYDKSWVSDFRCSFSTQ